MSSKNPVHDEVSRLEQDLKQYRDELDHLEHMVGRQQDDRALLDQTLDLTRRNLDTLNQKGTEPLSKFCEIIILGYQDIHRAHLF